MNKIRFSLPPARICLAHFLQLPGVALIMPPEPGPRDNDVSMMFSRSSLPTVEFCLPARVIWLPFRKITLALPLDCTDHLAPGCSPGLHVFASSPAGRRNWKAQRNKTHGQHLKVLSRALTGQGVVTRLALEKDELACSREGQS